MGRRSAFTTIAIILGLIGLVLGGIFVARLPRTLTIAVGPAGLETHRYVEALARASREAKDGTRYEVVTTSGAQESARRLEAREVNLAIVRSDYELPANGQTLVVNAKRLALVMAPQLRRGGIQKFGDLKGKRIAVARLTDPNLPLVRRMLAVAEIGEADATLIEAELSELPELLASGKAEAAIALVVPASPVVGELIPQIARRLPGGLRFVALAEAEAMANRIIGVETAELPAGIFGAGRPQEEVPTIAISYRIMARADMSNTVAGQTAKSLYDLRTRLSRQMPVAFTMEAPDAKSGARIPVHPGAQLFFDGESTTFIERHGEMILTGLWGASILGSALTGLLAWLSRKRHDEGGLLVEEIAALTGQARLAERKALPAIEGRVDQIVIELGRLRMRGHATENVMEAASLALDQFRSVADAMRSSAS